MNYNETENPMVLEECEWDYDSKDWEKENEIWAEKEDRAWEESIWNQ